ncbi:ROK family protein [Staphylococcus haemolyticus]|uniref:ROK family protein n=1 Tax=Staphylococcus TaxID=1279 RepID=UPI000F868AE3|nr:MULTISPECIES: ROK family protein [Staphylococcus]MBE7354847.1 ROK family protein [Staphylococcus haemolyticus]MCW9135075.1 ROK family protein [Staphylococcus sp. SUC_1.1]MCW9136916.1 ROK family protein [Staphylococcus haemolyticus]MDK8537014.1 ROK family protein [Staphylococcus haemolyticus]MDO0967838.1 ROK family protein [Staphylococcus haemolyticus]
MYKIAIDIGGTNIKVAVINDDLEMIDYKRIKTPDNINVQIVDETYQLVAAFMKQYQLKNPFIGISSAGVVDSDLGQIIYTGPTIPNYDGTQFFEVFKDLSSDIAVYNDVDAALLGELKLHHYEEDNIFCLTLGTGIGGAFYSQASGIYQGSRHRANEIGYLLYREEDGKTFEQRASTSALKDLMTKHQFEHGTDVPRLFNLAEDGNEEALNILNEWSNYVAEGIAQIQIIYDPSLILIGGGISSQGETLLKYIEPKIHHYLLSDYGIAKIQTTQTENHAALFGAITK